jgi:mannose-6-phosphate isomerase-like protein (cupin superfamily)
MLIGETAHQTPYSDEPTTPVDPSIHRKENPSLEHRAVNLKEKLSLIPDFWHPRLVGELNGQYVKLAKVKGEFIWHHHQNEDELFLVLKGALRLEFRDGSVTLGPGELYIVPRGVEHRPVAEEEAHILLFEPASTLNTGNVQDERTVTKLQRL